MMALAAHLAELSEKHKLLERRIEEEVTRPGSDDLEIHKLKLEKLKLKDEPALVGLRIVGAATVKPGSNDSNLKSSNCA